MQSLVICLAFLLSLLLPTSIEIDSTPSIPDVCTGRYAKKLILLRQFVGVVEPIPAAGVALWYVCEAVERTELLEWLLTADTIPMQPIVKERLATATISVQPIVKDRPATATLPVQPIVKERAVLWLPRYYWFLGFCLLCCGMGWRLRRRTGA